MMVSVIHTTLDPTDAVDEVQELSISGDPDGGTFTLTFDGETTAAIAFDATAATVEAALEALDNIGTGNVTCSGGPLPAAVTVTFSGSLSGLPVAEMTSTDSLTGGTDPASAITTETGGVQGSYRGAAPGCKLITTNGVGKVFYNSNTAASPVWTEIDV